MKSKMLVPPKRIARNAYTAVNTNGIIPMILLRRSKKEESDEMADENFIRAKALAGDLMHIVLCLATVAVPLMGFIPGSENWNWPRVMAWSFFILIGIQNLITGFAFKKLEE